MLPSHLAYFTIDMQPGCRASTPDSTGSTLDCPTSTPCLKCDDTYTRVGGGGSRVFNVGGGA